MIALLLALTLSGDAARALYDALKLPETGDEVVTTKAWTGETTVNCTKKRCVLDGLATVTGSAAKHLYESLPAAKDKRTFKGKLTLKCTNSIAPKDSYECDVTF